MKTFKLSLVAIAAISITSICSADSLEEALKNGKISGAIQAYNFSRNIEGGKDWQITTLGLDLSYETGRYNGFGAKATFQASSSPWANEEAKAAKYWDMYGSGGQLSEIYLSYKMSNTTTQIGRMYFWSPVLGGSGSRVNKEAVQGLTVTNTDLPDTSVTVAYVNKFQARTEVDPGWTRNSNDGKIGSFKKQTAGFISVPFEDGAYTIAVTNKSIENLTLTAAYLDVVDVFETAYFEAGYKFGNFGFSSQYYHSEQEDQEDTNLLGVQATATFGSVDLLAAYVTVDDAANVIPGLGNGADLAYTWSEEFANQYRADQDSYKLAATYNISSNAYVGASYVNEDDKVNSKEYGYTAIKGSYSFSGELDGLNIWAAYEMGSQDAKNDALRVKLNYTF